MKYIFFFLFPLFLFAREVTPVPILVRFHLNEASLERRGALQLATRSNDLISVGVQNDGLSLVEEASWNYWAVHGDKKQRGAVQQLFSLLNARGEVFLSSPFYFEGGSFERIKEFHQIFSGEEVILHVNLLSRVISVSNCALDLAIRN